MGKKIKSENDKNEENIVMNGNEELSISKKQEEILNGSGKVKKEVRKKEEVDSTAKGEVITCKRFKRDYFSRAQVKGSLKKELIQCGIIKDIV